MTTVDNSWQQLKSFEMVEKVLLQTFINNCNYSRVFNFFNDLKCGGQRFNWTLLVSCVVVFNCWRCFSSFQHFQRIWKFSVLTSVWALKSQMSLNCVEACCALCCVALKWTEPRARGPSASHQRLIGFFSPRDTLKTGQL